ncbi:hypothetical protein L2E82_49599 [Cichorium intybus]|uniref:Uncharacterized protein n=1 Tax=Cichorium intybus TaxID=13427 RepID=A0ACB8YZX8_CICIN|nr:hypothetical protein L2E82_49599 [Cichorium intybus]
MEARTRHLEYVLAIRFGFSSGIPLGDSSGILMGLGRKEEAWPETNCISSIALFTAVCYLSFAATSSTVLSDVTARGVLPDQHRYHPQFEMHIRLAFHPPTDEAFKTGFGSAGSCNMFIEVGHFSDLLMIGLDLLVHRTGSQKRSYSYAKELEQESSPSAGLQNAFCFGLSSSRVKISELDLVMGNTFSIWLQLKEVCNVFRNLKIKPGDERILFFNSFSFRQLVDLDENQLQMFDVKSAFHRKESECFSKRLHYYSCKLQLQVLHERIDTRLLMNKDSTLLFYEWSG